MHIAAILPLAVLPLALAVTHNVDVGQDKTGKQGLFYSPNSLTPAVNDTVVFTFYSNQHSVAQSTFDKPCVLVENGIFSDFPGKGKTFTITVNSTDPIWLFCTHPGHCPGGQSLVLNPPQDKTLKAYQTAAQKAEVSQSDQGGTPSLSGGTIADVGSVDTSASSSSSAASSTGTATAAKGTTATTGAPTATTKSPAASSTAAAGRLTVGAGLGAMGLLGVLASGMI